MNCDNSVSVSFHVTKVDKQMLFELANSNNMSVSQFCRGLVFQQLNRKSKVRKDKLVLKRELSVYLANLARIGNNLNQLTKLANSGQIPNSTELLNCLSEINTTKTEIMKRI